MSRVGKQPIEVPAGVEVAVAGSKVTVKGKLGSLEQQLPAGIEAKHEGGKLVVTRRKDDPQSRALHGLARALLRNHVRGVSQGYVKELEVHGVSYQAAVNGQKVTLKLGYANDIKFEAPAGVKVECPNPTLIVVRGADRQKVGQFAAEMRSVRPPEPYKGKGIRYKGEHVERKQGKSFVGTEQ
ncbi:MAG: 50S ribosomal protein L6 [Planctomycetes bacterium]|nr:50S ribosomal protein L6 [Planctomycetota bacterium]